MVIIDTSVIFDALVPGPRTELARALFETAGAISAPDFIAVELAGALTRAVRRGSIDDRFARQARLSAAGLLRTNQPFMPLLPRGFELSLELVHPVGDCIFLALAEARAAPLVTTDGRFVRKVADSRHAHLVLELSNWRP